MQSLYILPCILLIILSCWQNDAVINYEAVNFDGITSSLLSISMLCLHGAGVTERCREARREARLTAFLGNLGKPYQEG